MKRLIKKILFFNQTERDKWVAARASEVPPGSFVLDVGAGSCPYRLLFAHCNYKTHDFIGLNDEQLRDAGYGKIDYISDILSIPVPSGSVDVILCTEVLEHVPEPIRVIDELARMLKPGGKVFLTAPLGSGLHQHPFHYYGGYTPFWYERFLNASGFERIVVTPNGGFFLLWGQECQRCAILLAPWRGGLRALAFPLWLVVAPVLVIAIPLICRFLDKLDRNPDFTVGYHVSAVKKS